MITGTTEEKIFQVADEVKTSSVFKKIVGFFSSMKRRTILDIVIIVIPVIIIYIYLTGINPSEIRQTTKDNKKLELKIDSIRVDNQFVAKKMTDMETNQIQFFEIIKKNNEAIQENNRQLLILKRLYNAKINSVNGYSVSQLDSFFTNRYKEYYNR
jgi:hypothetical protein